MNEPGNVASRSWLRKFGHAFRGLAVGVRGQDSFLVHLPLAMLVILAGLVLRVTLVQWCLLILCITLVLAAELFNSALEWLARSLGSQSDTRVGNALDIASAAVLVSSLGAVVVGILVLLPSLLAHLGVD